MVRKLALATLALAAIAAAPARAQDLTVHRHLGFALRMDLGGGYMNSSASSVTVKGGGGQFGIVVGGAVTENLILGGHLWGFSASSPEVSSGGTTYSTSSDTSNTVSGIGLNLTYYFMPVNLYVSASPSVTRVSSKQGGVTGTSDAGFGTHLAVGKEWWVSDHWGLGIAGQFMFSSNSDGSGPSITTTAGAIAFSATYN